MQISNLENGNRRIAKRLGRFIVLEHEKDVSVAPANASQEYFMSQMGVHRRQLVVDVQPDESVVIQAGAMQWMAGSVQSGTGIKGVGDLLGKVVKSAVTSESVIKPEYSGHGLLVLEPTYKYILLMDVGEWGAKGLTVEDGMFYACSGSVKRKVTRRHSFSSAVIGGEGLFNLSLVGSGIAALESNVPEEELIAVDLRDEELKIDGNLAVCWSTELDFTVERTTKTLIGSAASGEGLVNVYRGTGRVLMSPVANSSSLFAATHELRAKVGK